MMAWHFDFYTICLPSGCMFAIKNIVTYDEFDDDHDDDAFKPPYYLPESLYIYML